ncbi:MAG: hypothetical protein JXB88_21950, partial [Spirochaetales bacterium]|nr:hypothetical protein [Spirochaetales bacterium]
MVLRGGITIRPSLARQDPSQDEALKQIQSFLMQERRSSASGRGGGWWFHLGKMVQQLTNEDSRCPSWL